jgi:hypothetical protein
MGGRLALPEWMLDSIIVALLAACEWTEPPLGSVSGHPAKGGVPSA